MARDLFTNLIYNNPDHQDQRHHEAITAQVARKREGGFKIDVKKVGLDQFYENNNDISKETKERITELYRIGDAIAAAVGPLQTTLKKGLFHAFLDCIDTVSFSRDYDIKNKNEFFDWFLQKDCDFSAAASKLTEEQKQDSYNHWITTFDKSVFYNRTNQKFLEAFEESEGEFLREGVVSKKRKSDERATFYQKKQLLVEQDSISRSGEALSATSLYRGDYEADHVKSVKDGGKTELENLELMTKTENRSKGSKSNEPHFPFQK